MPRTRPPYAEEFRRQMVDLVRTGRTPEKLARECEPCCRPISNWDNQADLDDGRRQERLTTDETEEMRELHREVRQLRVEREILKKASAWFAREPDSTTTERSRP